MYTRFFGLEQEPFSIAPDPRFLFMSERHREALAHLLYGLGGSGGFVLLSGEIGAGKTTLSRCFLEQVPANCNVAYIFNPKLTVIELLKSVCNEFGIADSKRPGAATVKDYLDPLNDYLLKTHAQGRNSVLIIDEAQSLSVEVLEQLRLLTNLETNERKLLQIILVGQPELRTMLAQPELEQLAQRVIARFHLEALSAAETTSYIAHRLGVAGMTGPMPFDQRALRRIYRLSRGVPRRINLLCDRAMLGAYASGTPTITRSVVERAAAEVFDRSALAALRRMRARRFARFAVAGATLVGATVLIVNAGILARLLNTAESLAKAPTRAAAPMGVASSARASSPRVSTRASAPASVAATDLNASLKLVPHTESEARRELAALWGFDLGHADACLTARQRGIHCFSGSGSLSLLRQIDRPSILTLYREGNRPDYVLLTGLTSRGATLRIAGVATKWRLDVLDQMWSGDFETFWRAPPGYRDQPAVAEPSEVATWLRSQLAELEGDRDSSQKPSETTSLKSRIYAFQLASGLTPDGIAGPITLMQLNRATGVNEPHLQTGI